MDSCASVHCLLEHKEKRAVLRVFFSPALSSLGRKQTGSLSMRSFVVAAVALLPSAYALTYHATDTFIGKDFLSSWSHEAIADPTRGRV